MNYLQINQKIIYIKNFFQVKIYFLSLFKNLKMKKITLTVLFSLSFFIVFSQTETKKKPSFGSNNLISHNVAYNFFVGTDANKFRTSPKAFGSGISDFSQTYTLFNFWLSRPIKRNIGIITTIGFDLNKYRFADNLYFDSDSNDIFIDNDQTHYYNESFFSRQGSKLVIGKLYIPFIVYLPVSHWFSDGNENFGLYFGAIYRPYLFAYHKLLFTNEQNQLVKNKTANPFINKYFNKNDIVVKAGLKIKSIFIYGQYSVLPFFNENMNYDIHEAQIGINFFFNFTSKLQKKLDDLEKKDNFNDGGTETK